MGGDGRMATEAQALFAQSRTSTARPPLGPMPADAYRDAHDLPPTRRGPAVEAEGTIGFREVREFILRALPYLTIGGLLGALAAVAFLQVATPQYMATAAVLYDPARTPRFSDEAPWLEPVVENRIRIDSQVGILTSRDLAQRVVNKLSLTDIPEFQPPNGRNWNAGARNYFATRHLLRHLRVRRVDTSSVLALSFVSTDPDLAANVANTLIDEYVAQEQEIIADVQRRGGEWLEQRLDSLRRQVFDAQRKVEEFRSAGQSGSISEAQVQLQELESEARTYRTLYESFLKKYTETLQRESYPVADSRIISTAASPKSPSFPNTTLILAFGLLFGMLVGALIAIARQSLDRRVRNLRTLSAQTGLDCLPVPRDAAKTLKTTMAALRPLREKLRYQLEQRAKRPMLIGIVAADDSVDGDRLARATAMLWKNSVMRVLVVEAARPAKGSKVLGDPPPPETLNAEARSGLLEALRDPHSLNDSVRFHKGAGAFTLPAGRVREDGEISDHVTKQSVAALAGALVDRFDIVIFALPSAESPDTRALSGYLDGVFIAGTFGVSHAETLKAAAPTLQKFQARLFGLVLLNTRDVRGQKGWASNAIGSAKQWVFKKRRFPSAKRLYASR